MNNKTLALAVVVALAFAAVPTVSAGPNDFGSQAAAGDWPVEYLIGTITPAFTAWDLDGDAAWDVGEPVFLDIDGDGIIEVNDIYLTDYDGKEAGSRVTAADTVSGKTGIASGLTINFVDATGDGYSTDDNLYLAAGTTLQAGDIDLATGTAVTSANSDVGATLDGTPVGTTTATFHYVEVSDGAASYGASDLVFWSIGGTGATTGVNIGDVYLSGTTAGPTPTTTTTTTTTTGTTGTTTTTTTTTQTTTTTTTTTAPPVTTTTTEEPGTTQTPGFELVALVAALGAALVLVRRRL